MDSIDDHGTPGACLGGTMANATASEVKYARLVFAPFNHTSPVVLAFHNITSSNSTYFNSTSHWIGDN